MLETKRAKLQAAQTHAETDHHQPLPHADETPSAKPPQQEIRSNHLTFLTQFDAFSNSLCSTVISDKSHDSTEAINPDTSFPIQYREIKFPKGNHQQNLSPYFTINVATVENYIESTKVKVDQKLSKTPKFPKNKNILIKDMKAMKTLKNPKLTIQPADKNLGVVILNSKDYVNQCLLHLASHAYVRTEVFPEKEIRKAIQDTVIKFKAQLAPHARSYKYLQPTQVHQIPKLYGLPKIHKLLNSECIPPVRPIVSHSSSLLSNTAHLIDHALQPLVQSYEDFLKNSTQLVTEPESITIPDNTLLITLDVCNLYPSIPPKECLEIIKKCAATQTS
uniref:Reverse transcriptase domain-containing protein n=1 Tax=Amphimedon queenslandica TaxID=400682 RepID=A0A1X7U504_AMPQE